MKIKAILKKILLIINPTYSIPSIIIDCNFPPYEIEYITTPENVQKLLSRVEAVWNNYGKNETYWSVLTSDKFLKKNLDKNNIEEFYQSGEGDMFGIENTLRRCGEWDTLNRKDCMEYGCGVGRVTIQLAKVFENVTALDISQGHLELGQQRIDTLGIKNISFQRIESINSLESLKKYDFIFAIIVLQHNPPPIIAILIECFFRLLKNNGIVIFQVPVQIAEYSFTIKDYLAKKIDYEHVEMHMLPQNVILEIARRNNCYLMEVHNDGCTGDHSKHISQTFVFKKIETSHTTEMLKQTKAQH